MQCRLRPSNSPLEYKENLDIYKLVVIFKEGTENNMSTGAKGV